jgi:hypothetical protein
MKSILNPAFKYTNAASTNIAKTFARIRAEQRKAEALAATSRVLDIKPRIKGKA